MTDDERIAKNALRFVFTGQPTSEWPAWMLFMNFGYDGGTQIVLHLFDEVVTVRLGDTVTRYQSGIVEISSNKILQFPQASPTLAEVAAVAAA